MVNSEQVLKIWIMLEMLQNKKGKPHSLPFSKIFSNQTTDLSKNNR